MDFVLCYEILCAESAAGKVAADIDGTPALSWTVGPISLNAVGSRIVELAELVSLVDEPFQAEIRLHVTFLDANTLEPLDETSARFRILSEASS